MKVKMTPTQDALMCRKEIRKYLAKIGAKGGATSRRVLTSEQARAMVEARESKRAEANSKKLPNNQ